MTKDKIIEEPYALCAKDLESTFNKVNVDYGCDLDTFFNLTYRGIEKSQRQCNVIKPALQQCTKLSPSSLNEAVFEGNYADGMVWAQEFCKRFPQVPVDDAFGWFANSIMTGYDHAPRQTKTAEVEPDIKKFSPKAGDVFIVKIKTDNTDEDEAVRIRKRYEKVMPPGVVVCVYCLPASDNIDVVHELKTPAQLKSEGLCPRCGRDGEWKAMGLVCREHGRYAG